MALIGNNANILLSICIPTYNRANFLKCCLEAIANQNISDLPIEIVISDNCSPDHTPEIIEKYKDNSMFRSVRQNENVGPMKNGLSLIKEHARGEFCWIIGDDDYILNGGIRSIVNVLRKHNHIDFIFVKVLDFVSNEDLKSQKIINNPDIELIPKFENLLQPKYSKLFLGELMGSIFRRNIWLGYDKIYQEIEHEYLSTLATSYTHCVIYANQFMGRKALYISSPMIFADLRAREWTDKYMYLLVEQMLALLTLYKSNGLKGKLKNVCERHYIRFSFPSFLSFLFRKNSLYRERISFQRYFKVLIFHPITAFGTIGSLILQKINLKNPNI